MQDNLSLSIIEHPLRRELAETVLVPPLPGVSLLDWRNRYVPLDVPCLIHLNGALVPEQKWATTYPMPGDYIVFCARIGDNDVLRVLAMVALIGISIAFPFLLPATWPAWAGLAMSAGIMMVGGLLINTLLPPSTATAKDTALDSQAYSWAAGNTQQQGIPVARWYGTHKVYGNIIGSYTESYDSDQYYNALIDVGIGPIKALWDFKVNDQPYTGYKEVTVQTRYGWLWQDAIDGFKATKTEYQESVEVVYGSPYTYVTVGSDFDILEVDISFPQGLWSLDTTTGDYAAYTISYSIDVRRVGAGDDEWVSITQGVEKDNVTSYDVAHYGSDQWLITPAPLAPRWSKGKVQKFIDLGDMNWWNWEEGSQVYEDHLEGEVADADNGLTWHWMGEYADIDGNISYETVLENVVYTVSYPATASASSQKPFRKTHSYSIPYDAHDQYEVRITRETESYDLTTIGDKFYFGGIREDLTDVFTYPRHALVAVRAKATDQLSGSFSFSCMCQGAIVQIWDGTDWTLDWSDNPAWIAYDILTQPLISGWHVVNYANIRYDGGIDPARIDLPKFLEWAQYCDDLVPDGKGGTEKRITFNGGFDYDGNMWDAFLKVCRVGRAAPVPFGTLISLAIDKPLVGDPVNMFTVANITESKFTETFLPLEERATQIEIDFTNKDNDYQRDKLTVYHPDMAANGFQASLDLFGIVKPSEAWRAGLYRLNCNKYLLRTVEIDLDVEAVNVQIGDVVYIQHDVPRWNTAGKVVSATANSVTLDKEVIH